MERDKLFKGRVLLVYVSLEGQDGRGLVLRDCSMREIAGRKFLYGTGVERGTNDNPHWLSGIETALSWDAVISLHSMTEEQFAAHESRHETALAD